ncbi:hypothetical protein COX27_01495 [Candidatus Kuenenbacteria bacterium CG23_combo_of_CG06-09_8_20_14_all_36_9]|nr:MAG: hypothetical protein COX27_01495 [Candidatus Kuenenbacteria bacterium CG23_combo_of_CG06-09_8_20_14_all_36_9]
MKELELNKIYNQDCLEGLKEMPDNSVDVVITDPPYWLGSYLSIDKNGQYVGDTKDIVNSWNVGDGYWIEKVLTEIHRVLKFGGYCLLFSIDRFVDLPAYNARKVGFDVCQSIYWKFEQGMPKGIDTRKRVEALIFHGNASTSSLRKQEYENPTGEEISVRAGNNGFINDVQIRKRKNGTKPLTEIGNYFEGTKYGLATLAPQIEIICVFRKKKKTENYAKDILESQKDTSIHPSVVNTRQIQEEDGIFPSQLIIEAPKPRGEEKQDNEHPTVKPLSLILKLIKLFTMPDQIVLDPFLGSGTTAVACVELNRKYIGFEIDKKYYNIAERRLQKIYDKPKLL